MKNIFHIENSFSCKAYGPKSRPESAKLSSTKTRYISTKIRISKFSAYKDARNSDSINSSRRVKATRSKMMCDVGCSTNDPQTSSYFSDVESPNKLCSQSINNHTTVFNKLTLSRFESKELITKLSPSSLRKTQVFIIPNMKRLIGLSYRKSLKPKAKVKSKKTIPE